MLIEFRTRNFRSLRDEQVFSLVASKDRELQETNTLSTGVSAVPKLLRSAVLFGANASGKSNVVKALQTMRELVLTSATLKPGQHLSVLPFRLDRATQAEPTEFEVTFLLNEVRYQYGVALTAERVVAEHLLVYKAFKPQHWFERKFVPETGKDRYVFGPGLKGQKNLWEQSTRSNSLFLSMAVQLNSEQLRPLFNWFTNELLLVNELSPLNPEFSIQMLQDEHLRSMFRDMLNAADISLTDIEVVTQRMPGHKWNLDLSTGKTELRSAEIDQRHLLFHHTTDKGNAIFELADESSGTRNLLFLVGPILKVLEAGLTLVIDELDTSLHPLLVRELVQLFHTPALNTAGAQLIFTTHDSSLLSADDLFRRDQVWFVEKGADQASRLYPLSDFSPRKTEALEKGYLMGRYGAVPFLRPLLAANS